MDESVFIDKNHVQNGPKLPIANHGNCLIKIDDENVLMTGGYSSR